MLYFIGLIPPLPLREEIHQMKLDFKENYESAHALNSPPHITLFPPFRIVEEIVAQKLLTDFAKKHSSFEVELKDFSHFGKRVIFIEVVEDKVLMNLQQTLENKIRNNTDVFQYHYAPRLYHPHLTLAFKDLSKENFHRAWEIYKSQKFKAHFIAEELILLKHKEKKWEIHAKYKLGEH